MVMTAVLAFASQSVKAQEFSSPEDLVGTLYGVYLAGGTVDRFDPYFSDRLSSALDRTQLNKDILGMLGLEALTGATKPGVLTVFNLESAKGGAFTAQAIVSFRNETVPVSMTFDLVLEPAYGWQIDHIRGTSGTARWCSEDLIARARANAPDLGHSAE
jgi:hypothetical protein